MIKYNYGFDSREDKGRDHLVQKDKVGRRSPEKEEEGPAEGQTAKQEEN